MKATPVNGRPELVVHDDPVFDRELAELIKQARRRLRETIAAEVDAARKLKELRQERHLLEKELDTLLDELSDPAPMPLFSGDKGTRGQGVYGRNLTSSIEPNLEKLLEAESELDEIEGPELDSNDGPHFTARYEDDFARVFGEDQALVLFGRCQTELDCELLLALCGLCGSLERWAPFFSRPTTDDQLQQVIVTEFGADRSSSPKPHRPGYFVRGKPRPAIWLGSKPDKDHQSLQGKALVNHVRYLLAIPQPVKEGQA